MGARKRNGSEHESDNKTDNGNSGSSVGAVNEIANELQDLFKSCKNSGLNDEQIRQCAQPLLQLIRKAYWRRFFRRCCIIVAVILLITALFYYEPFYRLFRAISRIAFIQLLPFYDWTRFYGKQCLVDNPHFQGRRLLREDCEVCEHVQRVERLTNVSAVLVSENFLKRDIPLVVSDGVGQWKARDLFDLDFLQKLYQSESYLRTSPPCTFSSNIRLKLNSPLTLLTKATRHEIDDWYAHWETCYRPAVKLLRQFYKRPYFMPAMVEMGETVWLFVSHNYSGKKYKPVDIAMPLMWFAQLRGQTKITLIANHPCNATCTQLYTTLKPGEILLATDFMWMMDYVPVGQGVNIALGSGGVFD